jgi:hypothetical protein
VKTPRICRRTYLNYPALAVATQLRTNTLTMTRLLYLIMGLLAASSAWSSIAVKPEQMRGPVPAVVSLLIPNSRGVDEHICAATKVGTFHFLTAAHCIFDEKQGAVRPSFQDGARFKILSGASLRDGERLAVTVEKSEIHPSFLEPRSGPKKAPPSFADVAVVKIREQTPGLRIAPIDYSPSLPGDPVLISGHGCSWPWGGRVSEVSGSMMHFKSNAGETTPVPALCHGESGGPVFRERSGELRVMGVNSRPGAIESLIARLDNGGPQTVASWLRQKLVF